MRWRCCVVALAILLAAASRAGETGSRRKAPAPPNITPCGGEYDLNTEVRVSIRAEPGADIVYTLDGSNPSEANGVRVRHNLAFFILPPRDVTVKAAAVKPGYPRSTVRRAVFVRSVKAGPKQRERMGNECLSQK